MIIVFPMAGLSSRFLNAGYKEPKYMLKIGAESVFLKAVSSFSKYFNAAKFLFIYRNIHNTSDFIKQECEKMGLLNYKAVELESTTLGQAHTTALGLEALKIPQYRSILIFNIDTFRPNFTLPDSSILEACGYLEVFRGEGEHWSFVLGDENGNVLKTAEKDRISSLCSSGLYYFKNAGDFLSVFKWSVENKQSVKGEYYIAPLYNRLIAMGKCVKFVEIPQKQIIFCGTPLEYEALKEAES
ncbi:MAG: glycosyltransferase family 2 protein [Helicobacteraceae bacterium]|nr:glycosyltransferase family 2 protein [Helicobacteraceae bacterium]